MLAKGKWPVQNQKLINEKAEKEVEAVDKVVSDIRHIEKIMNKSAKKAYLYVIPPELNNYNVVIKDIEKELAMEIKVFALNDKAKYDPENKSGKAKPNRPAIYLE